MRVAFIGTSHISGLKLGWELLSKDTKKNFDVTFIGYPAPVFAKQIHEGWLFVDNKIFPTEPSVKQFLKKMSGNPNTPISPLDYEVVCFVDLFFCYDFSLIYGSFNNSFYSSDKVLISESTYRTILKDRNGKATYNNHSVVGTLPEITVFPFINSIKKINPELKLFLTPRPFLPTQRLEKFKWSWRDTESILRAGSIFDLAATEILDKFDVSFLPRISEQISLDSGVTDDSFSMGILSDGVTMDEHANGEYGLHTIKQLLSELS